MIIIFERKIKKGDAWRCENMLQCPKKHNYLTVTLSTLLADNYKYYLEIASVFIIGDVKNLRVFINKHLKLDEDKETIKREAVRS